MKEFKKPKTERLHQPSFGFDSTVVLGLSSLMITMVVVFISSLTALPKPPTGLVASEVTATSVKLAWNMVIEDPVESYILQYKQKHPLGTKYDEVTDITGTDYTIHGLGAYTVYEFRVLAVNNIGRGTPSNPLDVSTGEMR